MSDATLSGPVFWDDENSALGKSGGHYNIYHIDGIGPRQPVDPEIGMQRLKAIFPDGQANYENLVVFSTSGVHGTYTTIEEIETAILKYGDDPEFLVNQPDNRPDDWCNILTVTVYHPRICCLKCGTARVRKADIQWLKELRQTSWDAFLTIGQ